VIGAVSPPGGDLSEPVPQNTMRIVKVFWGLDANLAYQRHFPAINWLNSYSLYTDQISNFIEERVGGNWLERRNEAMKLLNENEELQEIVSLVGEEALTQEQRLTLRMAQSVIEDFLHQFAFDEIDSYCSMEKQFMMLNMILDFYQGARNCLRKGESLGDILRSEFLVRISKARYVPQDQIDTIRQTWRKIQEEWIVE
jgi:V/A-type H+-transporting ATPase subunit A